jgi:probable HAF family extracellular repeat protein
MAKVSQYGQKSASRPKRSQRRVSLEALEERALLTSIVDLGTLPGGIESEPTGINDSGEVVGYSISGDNVYNAFLYSDGTMSDLGTLPGDIDSHATGINDYGDVVGYSTSAGNVAHAFLYDGEMTDLGILPGGNDSFAWGINDSGDVVGAADTDHESTDAFLYGDGMMSDLGTLAGGSNSTALAINDSGEIVGWSDAADGRYASLFSGDGGAPVALGTLPGGGASVATAINDSGDVVGYAYTSAGEQHAFLDADGTILDLGTLAGGDTSEALGINDSGDVVGWSETADGVRAFLYSSETGMVDLNSLLPRGSGWVLTTATAINDNGQIVGQGYSATGTDALLLNPSVIVPTSLAWDDAGGGVDYSYTISDGDLPEPTTVQLDWASGTTVNTIIGDPIVSTTTETAPGTYDLSATSAQLGAPPPGATELLEVADPDNLITSADPSKVISLAISGLWTGAGPDDLWSDGSNWEGGVAPGAGADLIFPSGAQQLKSQDDLGLTFNSITTGDNYEFSASGFLGTNDLTVQQGSLQLDDSATVMGTVTVMSGTTLTVGADATLDDQGAITVETGGIMDDEGSVTVDANGSLLIEGRLIVGTSASLDGEGSLTVTNDGAIDDFGQVSVGDTDPLTVSQGSLLVGANASLSDNGILTVDADASLAVYGTCTVNGDGTLDLLGFGSVGQGATLTISNGSLTEGTSGVLNNVGNVAVGANGSVAVGGSLTLVGTSGGQGSTGDNLGSIPITPNTPASTELEEQATQVAENADVGSDLITTLAEMYVKGLPEDIVTVQAADNLASWAEGVSSAASAVKYGADSSVLVSALRTNDQQRFAAGFNKLIRDILTDAAGAAAGLTAAYVTTATAVADDGASLPAVPLAALLGKIGGSFAYGVYYDQYLATGVTAQGSALFTRIKSGSTSATGGAGGSLSDGGSVTVQSTGDLDDEDAITVAVGSTLDAFGKLTEGASGELNTSGTVTVEPDGILDDFSPAVIDAGGTLNDEGAATVEPGASLDVDGTLDIANAGSLDIYGATVLEATALYQPLGTVTVQPDAYLGPPVLPRVISQPVDQTVPAGQQVSFTAAASGEPATTVQWQMSSDGGIDFSNVPGATSTTLTFTATAAQSGDEYRALFTNSSGSVATAARTLTVNPVQAVLALSGLIVTYDGAPHFATVTTDPPDLTGVTVTYSQNGVVVPAPTQPGSYSVTAMLDNPNYTATSATGTLVINAAAPLTITGEQPLFRRKTNKKGKPVGKSVLSAFLFDFSEALSPTSATSAANYQVDTITTKRVKKQTKRILHPITSFSVTYSPANDSVALTFAVKQTFRTGGQITVVGGPPFGVTGAALSGNVVFTISPGGRQISAQ